jgi:hypothetical protein
MKTCLAILNVSSLILVLLSVASLTGCAVHLLESQEPNIAIGKEVAGSNGRTEHAYFGLQDEVMAFSDQYTLTIWEAMDKILKRTNDPTKRIALQYRRLSLISSAGCLGHSIPIETFRL